MVEERTKTLAAYAETTRASTVWKTTARRSASLPPAPAYQYAKEALGDTRQLSEAGHGEPPAREQLIREFAAKCREGLCDGGAGRRHRDPLQEDLGIPVTGKDLFPRCGEFSQNVIAQKLLLRQRKRSALQLEAEIPVRPPVMCCGCPHRGVFYALKKLKRLCQRRHRLLHPGRQRPAERHGRLHLHGRFRLGAARLSTRPAEPEAEKTRVAVIGDSTFVHSGITGLIDIAYNQVQFRRSSCWTTPSPA